MIKLAWVFIIMSAQGPVAGHLPETASFKDGAACHAFGEKMTLRTADYVRGLLHLDWNVRVNVSFKCAALGQEI